MAPLITPLERERIEQSIKKGGEENTNTISLKKRWSERGTKTNSFVIYSYSLLQKDLYVFPEATGIIVPHSFGISKRFQQRSCLKYLPRISLNTFREVVNMLKTRLKTDYMH